MQHKESAVSGQYCPAVFELTANVKSLWLDYDDKDG